jgi:glycerophosphoryl diester phosphodiesterase
MQNFRPWRIWLLCAVAIAGAVAFDSAGAADPKIAVVAHRGLLLDTPENTLPNFTTCLEMQLGFEFDVRRSRDGVLVCIHDDTLDRTTDDSGPVAGRTLSELKKLDAGSWFSPDFRDARIPTIDEVLGLIAAHPDASGLYAVDMKADDEAVEADVVKLARKHGVVDRLLFIGRTIDRPEVRRRLRAADKSCRNAALANRREELSAAIAEPDADWVYLRFVPTAEDMAAIRAADKRAFVSGPAFAKPAAVPSPSDNWAQAVAAGVDGLLTDYALEFRRRFRAER